VKRLARLAIPFAGAVVGAALVEALSSGSIAGAIAAAKQAAVIFIKTRIVPRKYRDTTPKPQL
jgi:hypothetical protein